MKRILLIVLVISLIIIINSCMENYEPVELKMNGKNPTSYVFNATIPEVKEAIKLAHRGGLFEFADSLWMEGEKTMLEKPLILLRDPINKNDAAEWGAWGESKKYIDKKTGEPLYYDASYHFHLQELSKKSTKVEIRTLELKLTVGYRHYFSRKINIERSVAPTTIEEYEYLLRIGEVLGMKDKMPPIILPDTTATEDIK